VAEGWDFDAGGRDQPEGQIGRISKAQLAWLRNVLAEPAPNGTVLAFRHPPIVVPGVVVQDAPRAA